MIRTLACAVFSLAWATMAAGLDLSAFRPVDLPVGPGAADPSLAPLPDGRLAMSWTEPAPRGHAVRLAILGADGWGAPATIAEGTELFVNWADFASVAALSDGTLAAHWLRRSGPSSYAYDVNIALSRDDGRTWGPALIPHRDGTASQHGFVTLHPLEDDALAVWLDGRAHDGAMLEEGAVPGAMQLHAARLAPDGRAGPDLTLDPSTCSCCQTAAAMAGEDLLVVYRDRTEDEIRDISIVALRDGAWTAPRPVHHDGWEISGCPVNGPAIAALGPRVAVAWFTGAGDIPAIKLAFSEDAGLSFGPPVRIDHGQPVGRVDTVMLADGSALVSWIGWDGTGEVLSLCRATGAGCMAARSVARNDAGGTMNFPALAVVGGGVYLAWTHPLPGGTDTIRMLAAPLR